MYKVIYSPRAEKAKDRCVRNAIQEGVKSHGTEIKSV